jgi:hypothetical protein
MSVILQERLKAVEGIPLSVGSHPAPEDGEVPCAFCAEEKWAWICGLDWTDHPSNQSAVIAAFVRSFQDKTDQGGRDAIDVWMVGNAERLAATADDEHEQARGLLAADWACRVALPLWLELAGATDAAASLRARPAISSHADASAAREAINYLRGELGFPSWWTFREDLRRRVYAAVREALADKQEAEAAEAAAAEAAEAVAAAAEAAVEGAAAAAAAVYTAVRAKILELWGEKFAEVTTPLKASAIDLLNQMLAVGEG